MQLQGMHVLVVENDEMNATLLELQLAQAGAVMLGPAASVAEALRLIEEKPDLAILDYRLGGSETSEDVAHTLAERGIPFVLATGLGADDLPPVFARGVVLEKPYVTEELLAALAEAPGKLTA